MNRRNEEILEQSKRLLQRTRCRVPVVVLLALIEQEAQRQDGALSNTGRGLLHVRGQRPLRYGNTKRGIETTLLAGIRVLMELLDQAGGDVAKAVSLFPSRVSDGPAPPGYGRLVADRITSGEVARDFGPEFDVFLLSPEDRAVLAGLAAEPALERPEENAS